MRARLPLRTGEFESICASLCAVCGIRFEHRRFEPGTARLAPSLLPCVRRSQEHEGRIAMPPKRAVVLLVVAHPAGVLGSGGGVGPSFWVAVGEMMVRGVWPAAVPSPPGVGRPTPRTPWLSDLRRRPRGFCGKSLHIAPQLPAIMPPCESKQMIWQM